MPDADHIKYKAAFKKDLDLEKELNIQGIYPTLETRKRINELLKDAWGCRELNNIKKGVNYEI